jgi:hypothetical protein
VVAVTGGGIGGSGTTNYISKWTASGVLGNSLIYDDGTNVGIGNTSPASKLNVTGVIRSSNAGNSISTRIESDGLYTSGSDMYIDGSANIRFYSTSERMRITSAGNVGIGTTTTNVGGFGSTVVTVAGPSSTYGTIEIGKVTASTSSNLGVLSFFNGTNGDICNIIGVSTDANNSGALRFGTANAGTYGERMRITSETGTANVCIGTTSSPQANAGRGALTINGTSTSILTMAIGGAEKGYVYHNASEINLVNSTPGRLYCIAYTGGVYLNSGATSWTANSDERLKDITGNIENAVDSLMTLRAVKHTWKADEDKVEKLALIAQDVEKVFPQVVDKGKLPSKPNEEQTDETEYLGVRYQELIPVLVKAIQELKAEVDTLKQLVK